MMFLFLAGIGVFAWSYIQKNLDLQKEKGTLTSAVLYRLKEEEKCSDFALSQNRNPILRNPRRSFWSRK